MPRFFKSLSTLQWALGLSALLHAVLLTVRFVDPEGFNRVFKDTPLDVVLVNARSDERPDKAQAIAQHNLAGGGESADKRLVSTPLPPSMVDVQGDAAVDENQRQIDAMLQQQAQLLAAARQQLATLPAPNPERQSDDAQARAQEERRQQLVKLLAAIEQRVEEENSRPRKRFLSPATVGATYAAYWDEMRNRIEQRGTQSFPEIAGRRLYGELLMTLLINHDGTLLDARVLKSSGNRSLDRLAEAIAQGAAPFGNFTAAMRKDTDRLDVTARFRFTREMTLEATMQSDPLQAAGKEPR